MQREPSGEAPDGAHSTAATDCLGQLQGASGYLAHLFQRQLNPATSSLPALFGRGSTTAMPGPATGGAHTVQLERHQLRRHLRHSEPNSVLSQPNMIQVMQPLTALDIETSNKLHQPSPSLGMATFAHSITTKTNSTLSPPITSLSSSTTSLTLTSSSSTNGGFAMPMQQGQALQLLGSTEQQTFADWWNEYWSKQPFPSGYTQSSIFLLACLITTIIFLIVVGNLLVCIAIFTEKSLKPTQNWFIASLAVSDMLLGLVVMPFSLARELMGFWIFGPLWCDIHEAIDVLLTTASINTLCLISLDRYWSITQAVSYLKKRTPRRGAFMIAFVWIFSAAVSLPPLFGWKKQSPSIMSSQTISSTPSPSQAELAGVNEELVMMRLQGSVVEELQVGGGTSIASGGQAIEPASQGSEYPSCQLSDDVGYVLYSALGSFFIPCAVMVFTYIKIFLAARSRARRAISKQQNRIGTQSKRGNASVGPRNKATDQSSARALINSAPQLDNRAGQHRRPSQLRHQQSQQKLQQQQMKQQPHLPNIGEPPIRGKIVIVERKKSISVAPREGAGQQQLNEQGLNRHPHQSGQQQQQQQANRHIYTCSDIVKGKDENAAPIELDSCMKDKQRQPVVMKASDEQLQANEDNSLVLESNGLGDTGCILTTSGAKRASRSALNRSPSNDSSMLTVMNASMGELPVTRFNFRTQQPSNSTCLRKPESSFPQPQSKPEEGQLGPGMSDQQRAETSVDESPAAALLRAISSQRLGCPEDLMATSLLAADQGQACSSSERSNAPAHCNQLAAHHSQLPQQQQTIPSEEVASNAALEGKGNATNETCFMTIEEDSDMFNTQTGRSVIMLSSSIRNQTKKLATQAVCSAASPFTEQVGSICPASPSACARRHHRRHQNRCTSSSSYCGSYNDDDCEEDEDEDEDGDEDEEEEDDLDDRVDDDELSDDCNGFSVSCGLDQYSSCANCLECQNEVAAANASNYPITLPGSSLLSPSRQLSNMPDSPARRPGHQHGFGSSASGGHQHVCSISSTTSVRHDHHHHHHHQLQHHRRHLRLNSETEPQSILTNDDNLSLTEYKSNEDSSSVLGHDVLDATVPVSIAERRKASSAGPGQVGNHGTGSSAQSGQAQRKKSFIGIQLSKLGSSVPLGNQSVGLLDLATMSSQQQQAPASGRNLKALRQNFFMKLNQLTAKSAAKEEKSKNKSKRISDSSPTGKSSAQSSGTSYEQSIDCATTSNVHSTEYNQRSSNEEDRRLVHGQSIELESDMSSGLNKAKTLDHRIAGDGLMAEQTQRSGSSRSNNVNQTGSSSADKHNKGSLMRDQSATNGQGDQANLIGRHSGLLSSNSSEIVSSSNGKATNQQTEASNNDGRSESVQPNSKAVIKIGASGQNNYTNSTMMSSGQVTSSSIANRAYLASDNERHKRKLAKARERRATLILGLIMAAFICSWLPFFTFYVLRAICTVCREYIPSRFEAFIFWMGYCNSAINPIIYTIFNRDFRKAFRKILFKCL